MERVYYTQMTYCSARMHRFPFNYSYGFYCFTAGGINAGKTNAMRNQIKLHLKSAHMDVSIACIHDSRETDYSDFSVIHGKIETCIKLLGINLIDIIMK